MSSDGGDVVVEKQKKEYLFEGSFYYVLGKYTVWDMAYSHSSKPHSIGGFDWTCVIRKINNRPDLEVLAKMSLCSFNPPFTIIWTTESSSTTECW